MLQDFCAPITLFELKIHGMKYRGERGIIGYSTTSWVDQLSQLQMDCSKKQLIAALESFLSRPD